MKNWFSTSILTIAELKQEYRKLCFVHHPDMGGDVRNMQEINAEYDEVLKKIISHKSNDSYTEKTTFQDRDDEFFAEHELKKILEQLYILDGLEIEVVNVWLYISGETYKHKSELLKIGCKWNSQRKQWIYIGVKSSSHGKKSMQQIREKYGSYTVKSQNNKKITQC